jgi:hypothetical protein
MPDAIVRIVRSPSRGRARVLAATLAVTAALLAGACATRGSVIVGTKIPDTQTNRGILEVVETYRVAVEKRDTPTLLLMAAPGYWEDSGTPSGSDDYGFDGLKTVLSSRFQNATEIRYAMKYVSLRRSCHKGKGSDELEAGCRAQVDVLIDASYTVLDARDQPRRRDKRDQNQVVLEWNGEKWLFLSGM